jgi:hypothetical protein
VLPWLEEAARDARERHSLPQMPAFAWLASRGHWTLSSGDNWRHWLLAAIGVSDGMALLHRCPAGPCLALLAGSAAAGAAALACARPVHLAAALDHLRLVSAVPPAVSAGEAAELLQTVNAHIADRGYAVENAAAGEWLLRCEQPVECLTHDPAAAAGRNIHDFMPGGADGARMRSLMNELQMLLHEHPVNERRTRRRELPVNAIWLWGFGVPLSPGQLHTEADALALQRCRLVTDDAWLRGLWRAHDAAGDEWSTGASLPECNGEIALAITHPPAGDTSNALSLIDETLLRALRAALVEGRLDEICMMIGSRVVRIGAGARYKFWRGAGNTARWFA